MSSLLLPCHCPRHQPVPLKRSAAEAWTQPRVHSSPIRRGDADDAYAGTLCPVRHRWLLCQVQAVGPRPSLQSSIPGVMAEALSPLPSSPQELEIVASSLRHLELHGWQGRVVGGRGRTSRWDPGWLRCILPPPHLLRQLSMLPLHSLLLDVGWQGHPPQPICPLWACSVLTRPLSPCSDSSCFPHHQHPQTWVSVPQLGTDERMVMDLLPR